MTFQQWINGFEHRYTEDELWMIKWAFEVGSNKAQPIGTIVEFEGLIGNSNYEVVETGEIVLVSPMDSYLYKPTVNDGLKPVDPKEMGKFKNMTFMRIS